MISTIEHYPATIDQATGEIIDPSVDAYGFEITPTGLHAAREITLRDWGNAWDMLTGEYKRLERKATWIQFAIGDLLVLGENKFGEQILDFMDAFDYSAHSIQNIKSVARSIPPSRRRENLSWSHHAAVAALPEGKQNAVLTEAETGRLSVMETRERVRAENGQPLNDVLQCPNCEAVFNRNAFKRVTEKAAQ